MQMELWVRVRMKPIIYRGVIWLCALTQTEGKGGGKNRGKKLDRLAFFIAT